jgi:hypothetical protein
MGRARFKGRVMAAGAFATKRRCCSDLSSRLSIPLLSGGPNFR